MANTHILEQIKPNVFRVALHIPIPSANNNSGVNWQTALINSGTGGTTVLKDGDGTAGTISAAEKAQIVAGSLYEYVAVEEGQAIATVPVLFTRRSAEVLGFLQIKLGWYGGTV